MTSMSAWLKKKTITCVTGRHGDDDRDGLHTSRAWFGYRIWRWHHWHKYPECMEETRDG